MSVERIFDLVRKEQVVLWVGSGFSIYAGYPNGKKLSNDIYKSLTPTEKKEIESTLSLADLAEQIVRSRSSRNDLITLLKKIFNAAPKNLKYHNLIAGIPHIKTIITTNYDTLFEQAYKSEAVKIVDDVDFSYADKLIEIIKVHGDIDRPNSIILTKSDYANFFKNETNKTLFWSTVTQKISSNSVVFIGYDFEDDNVVNEFSKINDVLGGNRKEIFLIAPKLSKTKESYLIQNKIQYVDMTGEDFIEKLFENIKENIVDDLKNKITCIDTFHKFFNKNELVPVIKGFDDKVELKAVEGKSGKFDGKMLFTFNKDDESHKLFNDYINGNTFEDFVLDEKNLVDFKFKANDINLFKKTEGEYNKFVFTRQPNLEGIIDLVFENGFELNDISYKAFIANQKNDKVEFTYKNIKYTFKVTARHNEGVALTFSFSRIGAFENCTVALTHFSFIKYLLIGNKFSVYIKGNNEPILIDKLFKMGKTDISDIESYMDYYKKLKLVEEKYKISFRNIVEESEDNYHNMNLAINGADNIPVTAEKNDEFVFELTEDISAYPQDKISENGEIGLFVICNSKPTVVKIHNKEINIGYMRATITDAIIVNYEEVKKGEKSVKIKSVSNRQILEFFKDLPIL